MNRRSWIGVIAIASLACGQPPSTGTEPAAPKKPRSAMQHSGGQTAAHPAKDATPPAPVPIQIYNIGGDVKAPVIARLVEKAIPPGAPCRGLVLLRSVIDEHGIVTKVEDRSGRPDAFTRAYAEAIRSSTFQPATRFGKPVAVYFFTTVHIRCR